ncbi:MAG: carbohydrate binding family 9 domain-containing protein [Gemmatimonadota bacterium]|nr:carbohydrate binding family 9 domain-containing protein [Gemmatimonadota bacterium]
MLPFLFAAALCAESGRATPVPDVADATLPEVRAVRASHAPTIDGRLTEEDWLTAPVTAAFWQANPREGEPAAERTEIRVLYDDAALYVGARMCERDPRQLRASLTRRDGDSPSDLLTIALDSYHDHQTAMLFSVNPLGVRSDALVSGDQPHGDDSWDPVWEAAVSIDSLGWTAEIRIPLSQLRFPARAVQLWGVNVFRVRSASNERDALVLVRQNEKGFASRFAHLVGIHDLPTPRRLELMPYARGQIDAHRPAPGDPLFDGTATRQSLGLDLKYGVTSDLTLDATVNPDFGQVEADPAQLNLSVFETFFEERRPFFVEGAQIFAFGTDALTSPGQVFYSRRIGRAPVLSPDVGRVFAAGDRIVGPFTDSPVSTPILGAAKISGKLARGTSIGLLQAETGRVAGDVAGEQLFGRWTPSGNEGDSTFVVDRRVPVRYRDELEPRAHYTVGRLEQDFRGGRSSIGFVVTEALRDLDSPRLDSVFRREARTAGVDWQNRWSDNRFRLTGTAVWSSIRGSPSVITAAERSSARYYQRPDQSYLRVDSVTTALSGGTANAKLRFDGRSGFGFSVGGSLVSPGYELNDLGYLTEADRRTLLLSGSWSMPKPTARLRSLATEVVAQAAWNGGGERLSRSANINFVSFLQNNWGVFASAGGRLRGLSGQATRGGPAIVSSPSRQASLTLFTDSRRALSGSLFGYGFRTEFGTYSNGGGASLTWRPLPNAQLSVGPSYTATREMAYLVAAVPDTLAPATYGTRYVFGALRQTTLSMSTRANLTFTPTLSLQLYAEPFTSGASATNFRELLRPKSFDLDSYANDPNVSVLRQTTGSYGVAIERDGQVVTRFVIPNPDASYRSLRGSAVLRWEYRPGSTLYAVWQHTRSSYESGGRYGGLDDVRSLFALPPENILLLKANYWLSR